MKNSIIKKKTNKKVYRFINKKKNTKKTIQKAGVKLGKGSFGCVVKPAIPCSPLQNTEKYVSKIILNVDPENYKYEMEILNYIKRIDPTNKYCVSIIDECKLDFKKAFNRDDKDIVKVNFENVIEKNSGSNSSSKFSLVDKDFDSFQSENSKKQIQKNYCLVDPNQPYDYRNQIQVYGGYKIKPILKNKNNMYRKDYKLIRKNYKKLIKHLLEGCQLMHNNEFIHRDIKFENLVYSVVDNKPLFRYIDFGLSDLLKGNKKKEIMYSGTSAFVPIDYYLFFQMYKFSLSNYNLFDIKIRNKILNKVISKYIEYIDIIIVEINSNNDPILEGSINLIEEGGKKKLRLKTPTSKKPKLEYLSITDKDLFILYDKYKYIIKGDKNSLHNFYFKKFDGIVYKTDIFSLGIVIGLLLKLLKIVNPLLLDLIKKMIVKESSLRLNINQCLKHPFFK